MKKGFNKKSVFPVHPQTLLASNASHYIGWFDSQKIAKIKNPSSWNKLTVIAAAFFIITGVAWGINFLIGELEWRARQNNSWWAKGLSVPVHYSFPKDAEDGQIRDYTNGNYLEKPLVAQLHNFFSFWWHNTFSVSPALAAEAEKISWHSTLESVSHDVINIEPGHGITVEAVYKNTGTKVWKNKGLGFVSINVSNPYYHKSELEHDFWYSPDQPALLLEREIEPGESGTFRFALQAPDKRGVYKECFILSAENLKWFKESEITITFNVGDVIPALPDENPINLEEQIVNGDNETDDEGEILETSTTTQDLFTEDGIIKESLQISEPLIRVGLYKTTDPIVITADSGYYVKDGNDNILQRFNGGDKSVVTFDAYSREFMVSAPYFTSVLPLVSFYSNSTSTIFTITNYHNPPKWNPSLNDNSFRGGLEVRYGERSGKPWVINELLMEDYLKGIKETSEASPLEYHKAIAVAARSYALWQFKDGTKHEGNQFTVDAVWDQVYRGYNAELQIPTFSRAVKETEGIVVTYDGEVALTSYFAQSDGRTRSWSEVWFGKIKPWLQSVPDPTNAGLKLWGHGVGMSARGALIMASRQDKTYDEILHYYYTDVDLERFYKRGFTPEPGAEEELVIDDDFNDND